MKIRKVKKNEAGLKGCTISWSEPETRKDDKGENFQFEVEHEGVKYKAPLPEKMLKVFEKLERYVIDVCQFEKDINVEVHGVTDSTNGIILTAKVRTLETAFFAVNTPLLNEQVYEDYGKVLNDVQELFTETEAYIKNGTMMSRKQFTLKLFEGDAEGKEAFDGMSKEEKMKFYRESLEKNGAVVITQDDMAPAEETTETDNVHELSKTGS